MVPGFSSTRLGQEPRLIVAMAALAWLGAGGTFVGAGDAATAFGLAGILVILGLLRRDWPVPDRALVTLAALFVALVWISSFWTVDAGRTTRGALQITAIFVGSLVLLGQAQYLRDGSDWIFRAAMVGAMAGAALAVIDFLSGFPIMRHLVPHTDNMHAVAVKMDRGLAYLALLAWPLVAYSWTARLKRWTGALVALVIAAVGISYGTTAQLSILVGIVALAIATIAPAVIAMGLAIVSAAAALLTPFLALEFGPSLLPLAARIKPSAVHRLEIWDYMSRRALERPLTGWGWWTAHVLPIRPDELARYHYVTPSGSPHPHGNWVQLWVETGIVGVTLGLAFALLIIWRAWRLPKPIQPFALACCSSVFIIALASFDLATDSWWAILAVIGVLFGIIPRPANA